jgi:hypothetical protein
MTITYGRNQAKTSKPSIVINHPVPRATKNRSEKILQNHEITKITKLQNPNFRLGVSRSHEKYPEKLLLEAKKMKLCTCDYHGPFLCPRVEPRWDLWLGEEERQRLLFGDVVSSGSNGESGNGVGSNVENGGNTNGGNVGSNTNSNTNAGDFANSNPFVNPNPKLIPGTSSGRSFTDRRLLFPFYPGENGVDDSNQPMVGTGGPGGVKDVTSIVGDLGKNPTLIDADATVVSGTALSNLDPLSKASLDYSKSFNKRYGFETENSCSDDSNSMCNTMCFCILNVI